MVPLGLTGVRYGGSLLVVRLLRASVQFFDAIKELDGVVLMCLDGKLECPSFDQGWLCTVC